MAVSSRLGRLFVPDLAMVAAILTLLYVLVLFDGARKLFRDSDTGWHIRNGEAVLVSGALPRIDPYSWSRPGKPWFAWEWGADVAMGWVHRRAGLAGVTLLYAGLISLCTWLWFRLHWQCGTTFLLACALASPMLSTVNLHWLARPHIFGWVLMLAALHWLTRLRAGAGWRAGAVAFVISAVWANLHASFFLFPLFAMLFAGQHLLRPLIWRDCEGPPEHAAAFPHLVAAAGAVAGSFANPYLWNLHLHVAAYLTNRALLERIGEFQTFNFHTEGAWQILLAVLVGIAGAVLAAGQRKLAHAAILALLAVLALRSARALPLLALALPLAGGALTHWFAQTGRLPGALRYSSNLRGLEQRFAGLAWALPAAAAAWAILHVPAVAARTGFPPDEFPVEACSRVIASLPPQARILAPDKFGGYLIYRFQGQRKVFFDGRSDYYGLGFMRDYIELVQVRPGFEKPLERFGFTHALLPVNYSLAAVLPRLGWRETYRDGTAIVLEAPEISRSPGGTNRNGQGLN